MILFFLHKNLLNRCVNYYTILVNLYQRWPSMQANWINETTNTQSCWVLWRSTAMKQLLSLIFSTSQMAYCHSELPQWIFDWHLCRERGKWSEISKTHNKRTHAKTHTHTHSQKHTHTHTSSKNKNKSKRNQSFLENKQKCSNNKNFNVSVQICLSFPISSFFFFFLDISIGCACAALNNNEVHEFDFICCCCRFYSFAKQTIKEISISHQHLTKKYEERAKKLTI